VDADAEDARHADDAEAVDMLAYPSCRPGKGWRWLASW
jgi:hypothetical protein